MNRVPQINDITAPFLFGRSRADIAAAALRALATMLAQEKDIKAASYRRCEVNAAMRLRRAGADGGRDGLVGGTADCLQRRVPRNEGRKRAEQRDVV